MLLHLFAQLCCREKAKFCCSPVCKAAAGLGPEVSSRIKKGGLKKAQNKDKSQELTQSNDYCRQVKKEECFKSKQKRNKTNPKPNKHTKKSQTNGREVERDLYRHW